MAQTSFAAPPPTGSAVRAEPRVRSRKRGGPSPTGNFARLVPASGGTQERLANNARSNDEAATEKARVAGAEAQRQEALNPPMGQAERALANDRAQAAQDAEDARNLAESRAASDRFRQEFERRARIRQQQQAEAQTAATAASQPDSSGAQARVDDSMTPEQKAAQKQRTDDLMAKFNSHSGAGRGEFGQNQSINTNNHTEGIVPKQGAEGFSKTLFNGTRNYVNQTGLSPDTLNRTLRGFFGKELNFTDIGEMVGAPAGSTIRIDSANPYGVHMWIDNDLFELQERSFEKSPAGKLSTYNAHWKVHPDAPSSVGLNVFARQIDGSRKVGIKEIGVTAAGSGRSSGNHAGRPIRGMYVGYNTWARFGYNGPIPSNVQRQIPSSIKTSTGATPTTMNQLMAAPGGKDFWKRNGELFHGKFNLGDRSASIKQFKQFLKERPTRPKLGISYLDND